MRSSYATNNFGDLMKQYIITWQPATYVELGVLDGYSTLHIAQGLKELHKLRGWQPKLDAYDLFEDYEYKHGRMEEVKKILEGHDVAEYVNLQKGDAYKVYERYPDMVLDEVRGIEFLHIDISNTGKVIHDLMKLWHPKIGQRGIVMIEGGSDERDQFDWMTKYNMPPIKKEIESNELINKYYMYGTNFLWPSLTILLRKWWKIE